MTVKYDRDLGVWRVNGRGAYASQAEAEAADTGQAASNLTYDEGDYAATFSAPNRVLGAANTSPTIAMTPEQRAEQQRNFEQADAYYRAGITDLNGDGTINATDERLSGTAYGTPTSQGGTADGYAVKQVTLGKRDGKPIDGHNTRRLFSVKGLPGEGADGFSSAYSYYTDQYYRDAPGGTGPSVTGHIRTGTEPTGYAAGPAGEQATIRDFQAGQSETDAQVKFENKQQENEAENDNLFRDAVQRFDQLQGGEYALSDEARAYQQEGLAQQRMLLERLLNFDSEEYANQFADQALSKQIALGRQGTSAAAQQAGMFAAQEQAPALYAEGARQANALEAQRLGQAGDAAKAFGELGTMTRGQDETRAQFEAKLPVEIANSVAQLTQGKINLNQDEAQMFADIWQDFARLQSVYAGMSSAEQIAWWNEETARRGQDKTFAAIKEQIRANGAISDKDMINAFFQFGGGLLSMGGAQGSA